MAKRRVVLTGASGYVAQRMYAELAERWDLVPIDVRPATRDGKPVPGIIVADLTNPDRNAYRQHFKGADAIIHCGFVSAANLDATTWQNNSDAKFWAEHKNIALAYNVHRTALEEGVRRVVVCSSNHAADYYERLIWAGKMEMVTPEMPPRSDNWYGWAKAAYELLGFVFATGKVDGKKQEVAHRRPARRRRPRAARRSQDDAPRPRRLSLATRSGTAGHPHGGDGEHHRRARRALPDRLRHQRQHTSVLEHRQRPREDRLRAAGRQPGQLRREERRPPREALGLAVPVPARPPPRRPAGGCRLRYHRDEDPSPSNVAKRRHRHDHANHVGQAPSRLLERVREDVSRHRGGQGKQAQGIARTLAPPGR